MKKKGFTLIELIAVLAIMSVIFAVGYTRIDLVDRLKANSEIETFINDIYYCKMRAISTGKDHNLLLSKNSYMIVYTPNNSYRKRSTISRDVEYISFDYNEHTNDSITITFTKNGTVKGSNTYDIVVNPAADEVLIKRLAVKVGDGYARIYKKE